MSNTPKEGSSNASMSEESLVDSLALTGFEKSTETEGLAEDSTLTSDALRHVTSLLSHNSWSIADKELSVSASMRSSSELGLEFNEFNMVYSDHSEGIGHEYKLPAGTRYCELPGGLYQYTFNHFDGPVTASSPPLRMYLLPDGRELFQFVDNKYDNPTKLQEGTHFDAVIEYLKMRKAYLDRMAEIKLSEPIESPEDFDDFDDFDDEPELDEESEGDDL